MQGGENEGEREGESESEIEGPPSESEGLQGGLRRCDLQALTFTSRPFSLSLSFEIHLHLDDSTSGGIIAIRSYVRSKYFSY